MISDRKGFCLFSSRWNISVRSPCQRHFRPSPASIDGREKGAAVKAREAARQGLALTVAPLLAEMRKRGTEEKGENGFDCLRQGCTSVRKILPLTLPVWL
jgi:hypothetical protein